MSSDFANCELLQLLCQLTFNVQTQSQWHSQTPDCWWPSVSQLFIVFKNAFATGCEHKRRKRTQTCVRNRFTKANQSLSTEQLILLTHYSYRLNCAENMHSQFEAENMWRVKRRCHNGSPFINITPCCHLSSTK